MVSLRKLILAPQQSLLRDIMKRDLITVNATTDRRDVATILAQYDLIVVPVVDQANHLIGIITHDDVIDLMVKTQTEDMLKMGGRGAGSAGHSLPDDPFCIARSKTSGLARGTLFWRNADCLGHAAL